MNKVFWIGGNVPSSKNSRQFNIEKKMSFVSASAATWIRKSKADFISMKSNFLEAIEGLPTPYYIEFTFIRKTKHRFDYHNAIQIVADCMVKHGWIADDDTTILKPYFGDFVYDKDSPGVIITVLKKKPWHSFPLNEVNDGLITARNKMRNHEPDWEEHLKKVYERLNQQL